MAKFEKGTSGNPAGRPKGTGKVAKLRSAIEKHIPDIIEAMVARACDGDPAAARLLLERTVPPLNPTEVPVQVELPADDLAAAGRAILGAAAQGHLGIEQAGKLMTALGTMARVVEVAELAERIKQLESRIPK